MKELINPGFCKCGLWEMPLASILVLLLIMGCTKQEFIDLPGGDVTGSIVFKDIDYTSFQYPGISFQIKAQSDTLTYWTSADKNGKFNFSGLPSGGYNFTLLDNNIEVMSVRHCSFLGGAQPSVLSFWYRIQPDIKSIDYHFEIVKDTLWVIGKVELEGIPPVECNKIMLFLNLPPNNSQYFDISIPFDLKTHQIKYRLLQTYSLKSGDFFNSYIYKKYKDFGATFSNYVIKEDHSWNQYDKFSSSYKTASDSTSIYTYIIP